MTNHPREQKSYRWLSFVTAVFVTVLVISNIIAVKLVQVFGLFLPAAVVLFPVAYIFGDVLTEVYGYSQARRVIWTGFFCNLLAVLAIWIAGLLPPAPFWTANVYSTAEDAQRAYSAILGFTPRLLGASFIAYLVGEFLNSFVLAKIKVRTQGRYLWIRTIASTIVGEGADFGHLYHRGVPRRFTHPCPGHNHPFPMAVQGGLRNSGYPADLLGSQRTETRRT